MARVRSRWRFSGGIRRRLADGLTVVVSARGRRTLGGTAAGTVLVGVGAAAVVSGLVGAGMGDGFAGSGLMVATGAALALVGAVAVTLTRPPPTVGALELYGALVAALATGVVAVALVFMATSAPAHPVDALVEATAGVGTVSASLVADPARLDAGQLAFRALVQWLAGAGVIVIIVRVLPFLGAGGLEEAGGDAVSAAQRLWPTRWGSIRRLLRLYGGLTVVTTFAYRLAGMGGFDAVLHGLTTVSSGGWSTRADSIGAWGSPAVEWVALVAMFTVGVSLPLTFRALRNRRPGALLRSVEFRVYVIVVAVAWVALLVWSGETGHESIRRAGFAVVSTMSTTGFSAGGLARFGSQGVVLLTALAVVGGMAASITAGLKVSRGLAMVGLMGREVQAHLHPRAVRAVTVGSSPLDEPTIEQMTAEVTFAMLVAAAGYVGLALAGSGVLDAFTTTISSLSTVGVDWVATDPTSMLRLLSRPGRVVAAVLMFGGRGSLTPLMVVVASGLAGVSRTMRDLTGSVGTGGRRLRDHRGDRR